MGPTPEARPPEPRNRELAAFLRAKRERIRPEEVGLPSHGSRSRTKGLRREEVAQLAGIGSTWYTLLETGREISVSRKLLDRLSDALRLGEHERRHLFALARAHAAEYDDGSSAQPSALLTAIVDGFTAGPSMLVAADFELLAFNEFAHRIYGYGDWEPTDRNLLRHLYLDPTRRVLHDDWADTVRIATALFRANYGRHRDDTRFTALIEQLHAESREFSEIWAEPAVRGFYQMRLRVRHPALGLLAFEQQFLALPESPDTHVRFHIPVP